MSWLDDADKELDAEEREELAIQQRVDAYVEVLRPLVESNLREVARRTWGEGRYHLRDDRSGRTETWLVFISHDYPVHWWRACRCGPEADQCPDADHCYEVWLLFEQEGALRCFGTLRDQWRSHDQHGHDESLLDRFGKNLRPNTLDELSLREELKQRYVEMKETMR